MAHETHRNWAGNQEFAYTGSVVARRSGDVTSAMAGSGRLKAHGSRHSFSTIADSNGTVITLDETDPSVVLHPGERTVNISAGARYGEVCAVLHREGFALPNLASLPHISVAGACATGTHGSGDANAVLASSVTAIELVTASGAVQRFSRSGDPDVFPGLAVNLGALGIVTSVTLDVVPAFAVRQYVYERLPFDAAEAHLDDIMASAYSVSLFSDWHRPEFTTVWRKIRLGDIDPYDPSLPFFGALPAEHQVHPLPGHDALSCTPQLGDPGPAFERLPHFRMAFTPSSGDELQSEYLLPRVHAVAALNALLPIREHIAELLMVGEVRTVAADAFWMSPCSGRATVALHFTWKPDWPRLRELLPIIERALAPFEARPHWGKLFTMSEGEVRRLYPQRPQFVDLARKLDPAGRFRNAFLDKYVFG